MLHFGPQELIWECADETSCECAGIEVTQPKPEYARVLQEGSVKQIKDMWHRLVILYTDLELTFDYDRLPALAGLAKRFKDYRHGKYLAGLWEDTLVEDLLWHTDFPYARPEKWRAPTWSWASVDGGASYLYVRDSVQALCKVLGFQGTPLGPDSFGELSSANITLAGLTAPMDHHGDSSENSFDSEIHQFFVTKPG